MFRKPSRIMVVDGSELARTLICRSLAEQMEDVITTPCSNVSEALGQLDKAHYDLITTALLLPDRDGLELCRAVRKSESHRYTPVVVVSSDADSRLLREGFSAGVTDYFDKRRGYKALADFIASYLDRNSGLVGRVLYVEDSQTAATINRRIMEDHGLQVTHCTNAEQALEQLRKTRSGTPEEDAGFDVVVTDFYLRDGMSGGDLLYAIRAHLGLTQQEMPVLVVTGSSNHDKQADVFHAGANDFVTKPIVEEVLIARIRSLLLIKQQFTALRMQAETMQWLATTDSLTGVRNKRYLLDHGERFLGHCENQPVWAMLVDLDFFKQINDRLGHITGDRVLEAIGSQLQKDFPPEAMLVRFGGEEFAVLLPKSSESVAHNLAETLRRNIENLRPAGVDVTASMGIASTLTHPDLDLTELLALADKALYTAKEKGRNRICQFAARGIVDVSAGQPRSRTA